MGGAQGVPSPEWKGEGQGSGEEPGSAAVKDSPASGAGERSDSGGGNWRGLPRPSRLREGGVERGDL
jgi:hypothetical protein